MNKAGKIRCELPANTVIRNTLRPGDIGYLIYLHGILYAADFGWDCSFEAYVAEPLAQFAVNPSPRQRIWIVENNGVVAGSIAIAERSADVAQLHWFLLHPDLRGLGLGKTLLEAAIAFCRDCGYGSIFLITVRDLLAATRLYQSMGFELTEESSHEIWGATVVQQHYLLKLR